jgi:hypothetical protein
MSTFLMFGGIVFVFVCVFFIYLCIKMCVSGKIKNPGSVFVGNSDILPKDALLLPRSYIQSDQEKCACKKLRSFAKEIWDRKRLD